VRPRGGRPGSERRPKSGEGTRQRPSQTGDRGGGPRESQPGRAKPAAKGGPARFDERNDRARQREARGEQPRRGGPNERRSSWASGDTTGRSRPAGRATTERDSANRGGARLAAKSPRLPEPALLEGVTGRELDRDVHQQLRTLSKENAEGVAKHLVMVAALLEADELDAAMAHAETAVRRAGRVPAAREALGMVAYRQGDWARALGEFRTVRRLSGSSHLLPLMVDCERGLGRPERALDLAASPEAKDLSLAERIELAIVVSGIRRDLGQVDAAVIALQLPQLRSGAHRPWTARLFYAYADALLARGDRAGAREWFANAVDADTELETDAGERLSELDGVVLTDLLEADAADLLTGASGSEEDGHGGRESDATPR
jgi:tetratricopeptide (TPR) repeat protein